MSIMIVINHTIAIPCIQLTAPPLADHKWSPGSDDETDLIAAVGEFELNPSPPSSVNSLQFPP